MVEINPYSAENALSAPIVCSVPCKNCDIMRDSFAKTMRILHAIMHRFSRKNVMQKTR